MKRKEETEAHSEHGSVPSTDNEKLDKKERKKRLKQEKDAIYKAKEDKPHCAVFFKNKSRFCRQPLVEGQTYCTHHLVEQSKVVFCPLDPRHTVLVAHLEKHLAKKCPARLYKPPLYYAPGINAGEEDDDAPKVTEPVVDTPRPGNLEALPKQHPLQKANERDKSKREKPLSLLSDEALLAFIQRVYQAHSKVVSEFLPDHDLSKIPFLHLNHPACQSYFSPLSNNKHIIQHSSIIGHLERLSLLSPSLYYIEFGAGKGTLSHLIHSSIHQIPYAAGKKSLFCFFNCS
eukprot:TRINITY_DN931_c0_g1_i1.p1 TRINITY_DN931_c0_g1~~TRINITY_DN931_c0_g1_i1.p1  ORF type:complete len:299 (-),score=68.18 TRINITY_DN931_c0_g1_i1:1575-2438(-)